MALFYQPDLTAPHLTPEESHHAVRVLRLRVNDVVELTDGKGTFCQAVITNNHEHSTGIKITRSREVPRRDYFIHLGLAPTKSMPRMEWLVEKCTEIGIDKISFIRCAHSERPAMAVDRLQKLAIGAMKQSKQAWLPEVSEMAPFKQFMNNVTEDHRYIAHVDETNPHHLKELAKPKGSYLLLIGPEGDFTPDELGLAEANGFRKVNLGPNRLRTETAGLYGVTALNILNSNHT